MTKEDIFEQIKAKSSFLCVGLDTDISKIPSHLLSEKDPIFAFNKAIIAETERYAVSYKPNLAFYEAMGPKGLETLQKTMELIPKNIFTIADAKRGDIGNTSLCYANAFFNKEHAGFDFDSITLSPYMGKDSIEPYLSFDQKWAILLGLTSNSGSADFEELLAHDGRPVYMHVLEKSKAWGSDQNMMYVVGATKAEKLVEIRKILPDHFLLIPGVGAQGGSLLETAQYGMNNACGLLVNSSRGIIYADSSKDFAKVAGQEAKKMQEEMGRCLEKYCF